MRDKAYWDWSNKRRNLRLSLGIQWLSVHRPDILHIIDGEVDARFPKQGRDKSKIVLPDKLRDTK